MTYKIEVCSLPSPGSPLEIKSPGDGWFIEKAFPVLTSSSEMPSYVDMAVFDSSTGSEKKVRHESSRAVAHYTQICIIWKHYAPDSQPENDRVRGYADDEATTWA